MLCCAFCYAVPSAMLQVRLISGFPPLDFDRGARVFSLQVTALPNGISTSGTTAVITILILNVIEPPIVFDVFTRGVSELYPTLVAFGPPIAGVWALLSTVYSTVYCLLDCRLPAVYCLLSTV